MLPNDITESSNLADTPEEISPTIPNKCIEIKENGKRCGGNGCYPDMRCVWHTETLSPEEKKAARASGGRNKGLRVDIAPVELKTEKNVRDLLEWVATKLRQKLINARDAAVLTQIAKEGRAMIEASVESRVRALEKAMKAGKK
jgi:hypothetical protein